MLLVGFGVLIAYNDFNASLAYTSMYAYTYFSWTISILPMLI